MASKRPQIPRFIQADKDRLKRLVHIHPPHVGTPTPLTKEQIDYIQSLKTENSSMPRIVPLIPATDSYQIYYDGKGKYFAVGDEMGAGAYGHTNICWEIPMNTGEIGTWHVFKRQKQSIDSQQEMVALKKLGKLISSFDVGRINYSIQPLVDGNEFYKSVTRELKEMAEHIEKDAKKEHLFEKYSGFIEQCFDMGIEAISGMQELHKQGILHRDIKLKNMMWDRDGKIHYIDFGFASTSYKGKAIKDVLMGTRSLLSHRIYNKLVEEGTENIHLNHGYTPYDDTFALAASLLSNNIDINRQPTEDEIGRIKGKKPIKLKSIAFNLDRIINLAEKIGVSKYLVNHAQHIAQGIQAILNGKVDKPDALPKLMSDFKNVMMLLKNDIILKRGLDLSMAAMVRRENAQEIVKKQLQKFISAYISSHPNPSKKTPFSFPYSITDTNGKILREQAAINRLNELILTYPDVLTKEQRESENFKELQYDSEVFTLEIGLGLTSAERIPQRLKTFLSAYINDPSSSKLPFSFPYTITDTNGKILRGQAAVDKLNQLILTHPSALTKEQRETNSFKELQLNSSDNKKLLQNACTVPSRLYPIKEKYYLHAVFDYLKNQKELNTEKKLFIMIGAYDAVLEEMKSKFAPNKEPDKYFKTILEQRNKAIQLIKSLDPLNPKLNQDEIATKGKSAFLEKINAITLAIQGKDTKAKEIGYWTKKMNIPEDAKKYSADLEKHIMEKSTTPTISRESTSKLEN